MFDRQGPIFATVAALCVLPGCDLLTVSPPATSSPGEVFEIAGQRFTAETVVAGLEVPWAIGFSPDGERMFVTERPGRLRVIDVASGAVLGTTEIDAVAPPLPRSERGLMGLAVSPTFDEDAIVYVSYTIEVPGFLAVSNVVDRWQLVGTGFEPVDPQPIVDDLPAAFVHDGMPLGFGPDGKLYVSVGDATDSNAAQSLEALNGKYLRFNPDGTIPPDNPFGPESPVFSLGHRNSQGFDWHPEREGVLFATEHGSSAPIDGRGGQDELNRVLPGANYGWPLLRGDETMEGFSPPVYHTGEDTIAPGGGSFVSSLRYPAWTNRFIFAGLADQQLWVAQLDPNDPSRLASIQAGLTGAFGRLRAVADGPDGYIYISTSNRDSRGTPVDGDDRILRLVPVE